MARVQLTIANDGSDGAAHAISAAGRLFAGAAAKVVVVPDPTPTGIPADRLAGITTAIERHAQGVAEAGAEAAAAAGLDARGVVASPQAPAWEGLLEAAAGSDVIVCGSRGQSGLARAMLGSTSTSLLHHSPLPLLIVPDASPAAGPAVLTYDGSDVAGHAIGVAGPLLDGRPAVVVHVWESPYKHSLSGRALSGVAELEGIVDELEGRLADSAREVTESGVGLARFAGLDARGETLDSGEGVWRAVAPFAATLDAAVIVTGARGHGGARSALLGSVSSGLAHHAGRPVLIVPSS
jgi:nucleotide-binding universal stress UspA family protein